MHLMTDNTTKAKRNQLLRELAHHERALRDKYKARHGSWTAEKKRIRTVTGQFKAGDSWDVRGDPSHRRFYTTTPHLREYGWGTDGYSYYKRMMGTPQWKPSATNRNKYSNNAIVMHRKGKGGEAWTFTTNSEDNLIDQERAYERKIKKMDKKQRQRRGRV
jgi:hypothetical protein